jgi:hypothetical protein
MNIALLTSVFFFTVILDFARSEEYQGGLKAQYLICSDVVLFGTDRQPPGTCEHWNRYFKFDSTTAAGRNMLSVILAAMLADKQIDVWYLKSPVPGTTHSNGCTVENLSVVTRIGLR